MRTGPGAALALLPVLAVLAVTPQQGTRATWVDTAPVTASVATLDISPTLTCTELDRQVRISWTVPAAPYGWAPVDHLVTLQRSGFPSTTLPVSGLDGQRWVVVDAGTPLLGYSWTVEVTTVLPGTTWTVQRVHSGSVRSILGRWEARCA